MARAKIEDRNIRKLSKVGGGKTYSITIPIETIRKFGWKEGQKLVIKEVGEEKIEISDWEG
jgi:bifunctional DNA-binding transcriptional regulator/antitoxin component of YhaV-PrlF toxin-antitoxin module